MRKTEKQKRRKTKKTYKNRNSFRKKNKKMRAGNKSSHLCPDANVSCNLLDKHYTENGKVNETWDTCINMNGINNHIIYITPKNMIIKSIESMQVPEFVVKLPGEKESVSCKIMIEDKYVGCFLKVCGEWYVIMRLFGKTLNTGVLARTEGNKVFYKIDGITINADNPENDNSLILFKNKNSYEETPDTTLLSSTKTKVIKLTAGHFTNIDKKNDVFHVMQRFRQQKIFAEASKEEVAYNVAENVADEIFKFW
jgi:hypothetical protein